MEKYSAGTVGRVTLDDDDADAEVDDDDGLCCKKTDLKYPL
jgi:hypothetical protein